MSHAIDHYYDLNSYYISKCQEEIVIISLIQIFQSITLTILIELLK
jgi:hypothetical protein